MRVVVDDEAVAGAPSMSRRAIVIASAAAVASSSSEALATSSPVSSATIVWKLSSASRRPWLISGWYGVYAVYHAGSSSTLRWMTPRRDRGGVAHPDQARAGRVASGELAQRSEHLGLRARRRQLERERRCGSPPARSRRAARRARRTPRTSSIRARSSGSGPMCRATNSSWLISWARGVGMLGSDARRVLGPPRCHRYLRVSPGAVAELSPSASPVPGDRTAFQRCLAHPVRSPERFRGRLLLRRRPQSDGSPGRDRQQGRGYRPESRRGRFVPRCRTSRIPS